MPSRNILTNVNLTVSTERRGVGGGCPNPALNPAASCGTNLLSYTVLSFDEQAQKWYPANANGFYTSSVDTAGTITGSAYLLNINENGCIYPAVYFSGSATFPLSTNSVYLAIVTGSFSLSGTSAPGYGWSISDAYQNTGSTNISFGGGGATSYQSEEQTNKNALVGFGLGNYVSPFNRREVTYFVSGSAIATNPPVTSLNYPATLGTTMTLSGVGIIRAFGYGGGGADQQTQYNCLYGTTPTK